MIDKDVELRRLEQENVRLRAGIETIRMIAAIDAAFPLEIGSRCYTAIKAEANRLLAGAEEE